MVDQFVNFFIDIPFIFAGLAVLLTLYRFPRMIRKLFRGAEPEPTLRLRAGCLSVLHTPRRRPAPKEDAIQSPRR